MVCEAVKRHPAPSWGTGWRDPSSLPCEALPLPRRGEDLPVSYRISQSRFRLSGGCCAVNLSAAAAAPVVHLGIELRPGRTSQSRCWSRQFYVLSGQASLASWADVPSPRRERERVEGYAATSARMSATTVGSTVMPAASEAVTASAPRFRMKSLPASRQ